MKIPSSTRILGKRYATEWVRGLKNSRKVPLYGQIDLDGLVIRLDCVLGRMPTRRAEIYMHEILHGLSDGRGLRLSEKQVTGLAQDIVKVIRANNLDFRKGGATGKGR